MDGVLIIDKPEGFTSHDVVARARRLLRERRVGHTGTLDPFATGVLVLLVGRATRLAQFLAGDEKEYEAAVRFGHSTETGDRTGAPLGEPAAVPRWDGAQIEAALQLLRGEIDQVPPMYSARKIGGRKLYELARRGETVERKPARVVISLLEAVRFADGELLRRAAGEEAAGHEIVEMSLRVVCSAGTYVRVLAEDIGRNLGVGAHLTALRRTRAGDFSLARSVTLDELQRRAEAEASLAEIIISPSAALSRMPCLHLTADEARRARHGAALRVEDRGVFADQQHLRLEDETGRLIAIGVYDEIDQMVRPRVTLDAE